MQNRKALGRGLDVLIPKTEVNKNFAVPNLGERVKTVPIDSIVPNRLQPRKIFDEEKIKDLAASIKEQGIIQPLIVTQASPNRYELIAGERRLRAAKTAGLAEVPVVIKNVDTESMLELSLIENVQREDLNPIEEALAYKELIGQYQYTQDELAKRLGRDRSSIANMLRLLKLPEEVRAHIISGQISMGHARAILGVENRELQQTIANQII